MALTVEASIYWREIQFVDTAVLHNLSEQGAFLATSVPLPVFTMVTISPTANREVRVPATVTQVNEACQRPAIGTGPTVPGMSLRFEAAGDLLLPYGEDDQANPEPRAEAIPRRRSAAIARLSAPKPARVEGEVDEPIVELTRRKRPSGEATPTTAQSLGAGEAPAPSAEPARAKNADPAPSPLQRGRADSGDDDDDDDAYIEPADTPTDGFEDDDESPAHSSAETAPSPQPVVARAPSPALSISGEIQLESVRRAVQARTADATADAERSVIVDSQGEESAAPLASSEAALSTDSESETAADGGESFEDDDGGAESPAAQSPGTPASAGDDAAARPPKKSRTRRRKKK